MVTAFTCRWLLPDHRFSFLKSSCMYCIQRNASSYLSIYARRERQVHKVSKTIWMKMTLNTSSLSPSTVGAMRPHLVGLFSPWIQREEKCSRSLLHRKEENLEELDNTFLYQACAGCPVNGPETLWYFRARFLVWDECESLKLDRSSKSPLLWSPSWV